MSLKEFSLVLYKQRPAIVTGRDGDKYEITLADDKKKVREKDTVPLHEGPVKSIATVLNAPLPPGDLAEAVDFFAEDPASFSEIAELVWGKLSPDAAWVAWQTLVESPWFECSTPDEPVRVRPREEAEAIIRKGAMKQAEADEREAFAGRLRATMAGKGSNGGVTLPDDAKFLQDVEALALGNSDKSRSLKDAGIAETRENAHRVLLQCGYWPLERNPWPNRRGHTLATSSIPIVEPSAEPDALDLTHLESFAIDNAWSTDPDDAVCVEDGALWVHIADPAATVTPDSPAELDARARGATLYVPEGAARMLGDQALEWYALGLSPVSRALSFKITFTETGAVESVEIKKTLIRVTRLTYAQATERRSEPALAPLFAIAERNIARRTAAGAVSIELPEVHLSVKRDSDNRPVVTIDQVKDEIAADMVREMMLLAGEAAARFAFKNGIPFQYVSQEAPDIPKDLPEGLAGEYRKRRSMKSRKVGTVPADHAGLGIGMYSQVTSPLRRYGDLIAHQQLRAFIAGEKPLDEDELLMRIAAADTSARECTMAERESNLHWVLVHLSRNPDWRGKAVVVERNGAMTTLLVPELAQEAKISIKADLPLNAEITVRAGSIDIPTQKVSFIPEGE